MRELGTSFNLDEVNEHLLDVMLEEKLSFHLREEWMVITRQNFDLFHEREPHSVLALLLDLETGAWISRAWQRTVAKGHAGALLDLPGVVRGAFQRVLPCRGVDVTAALNVCHRGLNAMDAPFKRMTAKGCEQILRVKEDLMPVVGVSSAKLESTGVCDACRDIMLKCDKVTKYEDLLNGDEKMNSSEPEEEESDEKKKRRVREERDLEGVKSAAKKQVSSLLEREDLSIFRTSEPRPPGYVSEPEEPDEIVPKAIVPLVKSEEDSDYDYDEDKRSKKQRRNYKEEEFSEGEEEEEEEEVSYDEDEEFDEDDEPASKYLEELPIAIGDYKEGSKKAKRRGRKQGLKREIPTVAEDYFKCEYCPYDGTKNSVDKHARKEHLKGRFYCDYCGNFQPTVPIMLAHCDKDHPEYDKVVCVFCSEFVFKTEYVEHYKGCLEKEKSASVKKCHKEKPTHPFKCAICAKVFRKRFNLNVHLHQHAGQVFTCEECGFRTNSVFGLQSHKKRHKKERGEPGTSYFCHLCAKSYASAFYLDEHIRYFHEKKADNVRCEHCGLNFERKRNYVKHCNKEHSDDPKYQCKICSRRFETASAKDRHEFSHSGLPAAFCDLCGKGLKTKKSLKAHMLAHKGEKPYKCNMPDCEYACVSSTALSLHKRFKHRGGEPMAVSKANGRA